MVLTRTLILILRHLYLDSVRKHPSFNMYFNIIVSISTSSETLFFKVLITQIL